MTPNRVAALGSAAVSLGALVTAFVGVFPHSWQNLVLGTAALLGHVPVVVTYLIGSQKSEQLQAWYGNQAQQPSVTAPAADPGYNPDHALTPEA